MALTLDEIKKRIQSPNKSQVIAKAIKHESRLRFHTESAMDQNEIVQPLTIFLDWVKTLIPRDKYNIFVSLFKLPSPIIQLSDTIFKELERVFDGRNPTYNYQFTDADYRDDWERYKQDNLKEPQVWRDKGWKAVRTAINSVLIVDLPIEQTTDAPEPYFYFLGVENVLDYTYKDGVITDIFFRQSNNRLAVFDDEEYRVFQMSEDNQTIKAEISKQPHGLGYCPADFFWSTELSQKTPDIKKSPLSPQLANLDWLLFFAISKRHLDLYASYPIYSAYEASCDFEDKLTGDICDGGYLRDKDDMYKIERNGAIQVCPVCSNKRLAGAGSMIEIPIPTKEEPDLKNPVQITTIDKDSLAYNVEEVKRLTNEVFTSTVGLGGDVQQKQSLNELQVTAGFESRVGVLNNLKGNLEKARKFADDTICRLRYGDNFLKSSISMGTEFYIYTVVDLYANYKRAKENGASESELDAINDQILATEYRNNPTQLERMFILKQLEPYSHYSLNELMTLKNNDFLNPELLIIKINFNTFVERFERENTNVIEFGSQLELSKKINIIIQKFKDYGREQQEQPNGDQ